MFIKGSFECPQPARFFFFYCYFISPRAKSNFAAVLLILILLLLVLLCWHRVIKAPRVLIAIDQQLRRGRGRREIVGVDWGSCCCCSCCCSIILAGPNFELNANILVMYSSNKYLEVALFIWVIKIYLHSMMPYGNK